MYSQQPPASPCKALTGDRTRAELENNPIKAYEWVLQLLTHEDSAFYHGLNEPMCRVIAGEPTYGALSHIFKEPIMTVSDVKNLKDCRLPNGDEVTEIKEVLQLATHQAKFGNLQPQKLKYPPIGGKPMPSSMRGGNSKGGKSGDTLEVLTSYLKGEANPSPKIILLHFTKSNYTFTVTFDESDFGTSLYTVAKDLKEEKKDFFVSPRTRFKLLGRSVVRLLLPLKKQT